MKSEIVKSPAEQGTNRLRLWLVVNGIFQKVVWATDKEDAIKKVPLTYANAYEIKQERQ